MMVIVLALAIAVCAGCIGGYLYLGSARYATRKALRAARKQREQGRWL